jgi:midasin
VVMPSSPPFVLTPTVVRNMQGAALALCAGRPLLLEGPPGSGKTALINELAARTGNATDMVSACKLSVQARGCTAAA